MPRYAIQGSLIYSATVSVEANSPEEALEKAERDEWDMMVEEGRWKDAGGFTALDGEESVELIDDDDEEIDDPYEVELGDEE